MSQAQSRSVILITGVTSGIGLALAKKLILLNKYTLILTGRNISNRLEELKFKVSENIFFYDLDVSEPSQNIKLFKQIEENWGGVDVLVNNAGISYRAVTEHMSEQDLLHQLKVNFIGPMELIRLSLPKMRAKRAGQIINISSVGGMMAMPTMGAYSASKFALEGATEALWYEVKAWNIKVSLIQPGFINSNSFKKVYWSEASKHSVDSKGVCEYSAYYQYMGSFIERLMKLTFATSESVASKIIDTINNENPPLRVPATFDAIVFSFIRRFLPRPIYHQVLFFFLPGIRNACRFNKEEEENAHPKN